MSSQPGSRTVLLTGGARGIGAAIAARLAGAGCNTGHMGAMAEIVVWFCFIAY